MAEPRPLQGLSGLYGVAGGRELTGRDPRQAWGGPPDRRHEIPGDASTLAQAEYSDAPVYGSEVSAEPEIRTTPLPGLEVVDQTPTTHAAPYPAGVPQDPTVAAAQMRTLHGLDLGAPDVFRRVPVERQGPVEGHRDDSPNVTAQAGGVPVQLRGGLAAKDTAQGNGAENGYGFQFGRLFRRVVRDGVPLDRTGAVSQERPFYGHHPVQQTTYDTDSPYGEVYGNTRVGMQRPSPTGYATPYEQPANPTMRPTADYGEEAGMSGGWAAG